MHVTKKFSRDGLSREQKEAEALKQVMAWLSDKQKETLRHYAVTEPGGAIGMYRTTNIMLSFAGVTGYWTTRATVRWMLQQRADALKG